MDQNSQFSTTQKFLYISLWLIGSILAIGLYMAPIGLASICSRDSGIFMWIIYMLWAGLLGPIYLIYYVLYRVFLGNKC